MDETADMRRETGEIPDFSDLCARFGEPARPRYSRALPSPVPRPPSAI